MAQRKKRGAARKATLKRGRAPKRARTRMVKRVAAKTTPKKRVTKAKAKRAVTKKAATKAAGPPPQGDAAAEKVIVDVIEEPVPGVTVVTEFEATRVQVHKRNKSGRPASSALARAVRSEWGAGTQMNRTQREPLARFNRQSQDLAKSIGVYPPSLPTPSSRAGAFF